MAPHPESCPGTNSGTKIRRRPKEPVAAGAQENGRISACVGGKGARGERLMREARTLFLISSSTELAYTRFAARTCATCGAPIPQIFVSRCGGRVRHGYYVCSRATCHPPLTFTPHMIPRPLSRTNALLCSFSATLSTKSSRSSSDGMIWVGCGVAGVHQRGWGRSSDA